MYIKIIGVGSPFGADNLAQNTIIHLERLLETKRDSIRQLEILYLDRPGVNLLAHFSGVDYLILIDAVLTTGQAGEILEIEIKDLPANGGLSYSGHAIGVAEALSLAQTLGTLPPKVKLYGIGIIDFAESKETPEAVNKLANMLAEDLVNYK